MNPLVTRMATILLLLFYTILSSFVLLLLLLLLLRIFFCIIMFDTYAIGFVFVLYCIDIQFSSVQFDSIQSNPIRLSRIVSSYRCTVSIQFTCCESYLLCCLKLTWMFCYRFNCVIIFLVSSSCDVDLVCLIFEIDAYDISLHLFYPMLTIMVEL